MNRVGRSYERPTVNIDLGYRVLETDPARAEALMKSVGVYADQNESDHAAMIEAVHVGRLEAFVEE
jgi:hypothetical protein